MFTVPDQNGNERPYDSFIVNYRDHSTCGLREEARQTFVQGGSPPWIDPVNVEHLKSLTLTTSLVD